MDTRQITVSVLVGSANSTPIQPNSGTLSLTANICFCRPIRNSENVPGLSHQTTGNISQQDCCHGISRTPARGVLRTEFGCNCTCMILHQQFKMRRCYKHGERGGVAVMQWQGLTYNTSNSITKTPTVQLGKVS